MSTEENNDTPAAPRRRIRTPVIASVVAAVLVAGGGAYWASTAAGGGHSSGAGASGDGNPPPLALEGYAQNQIAPGEPDPQGGGFRATGHLPSGPDHAPVYRPAHEVTRQAVARLAEALGVKGSVRAEDGAWAVGARSRSDRSPVLRVTRSGTGAWTYSRYGAKGGTNCALPAGPKESGSDGDSAATRAGCPTYRGATGAAADDDGSGRGAVSTARAEAAAAPVLRAMGQPHARLDAGQLTGTVRVVTADPVVGGLPTYGWQSDLQIDASGDVVGGDGQLAEPVKGDDYPVLSASDTLALLNKGQGLHAGAQGCTAAGHNPSPGPCGSGQGGGTKPTEVTGARFGLSTQYADGKPALVPSWLYTTRPAGGSSASKGGTDALTVAQPAVDPKYVVGRDGSGSGKSSAPPSTPPTDPSGQSSGRHAERVDSYTVEAGGRELTLHFTAGVCATFAGSAKESGSSVAVGVTARDKHPGKPCPMIAKTFSKTVELDKPLGHRKVRDTMSGETLKPVKAAQH